MNNYDYLNSWGYDGGTNIFVSLASKTVDENKVEEIVDTKVNSLKDGAPEEYDTFKEVSDYIAEHTEDFKNLKETIESLQTDGQLATEEWVNEQGFLKEHQDLSNYVTKEELPKEYDDTEIKNLIEDKQDKGNYVEYTEFDGTHNTIQLNNGDSVSGKTSNGDNANLITLSEHGELDFDVTEVGSTQTGLVLKTCEGVVKIENKENKQKTIATTDDVETVNALLQSIQEKVAKLDETISQLNNDLSEVDTKIAKVDTKIDDALYTTKIDGYEFVDLGLPSGNLWATRNIGASSPEDIGLYFQWADYEGYADNAEKTFNGGVGNYKYNPANSSSNILSTPSKYNKTDGLTSIEDADDAANVQWGGNWHIPSNDEFKEMYENCIWGEGDGYLKLTSRHNGRSIIFPNTGYYDGNGLKQSGEGYYWANNVTGATGFTADYFHTGSWGLYEVLNSFFRANGLAIRPICRNANAKAEIEDKYATKSEVSSLQAEIEELKELMPKD